jgi:hypothetical protein
MATEDLIEIGNMLYERRGDGVLYPVRRVRSDTEARGAPAQDPSLLNVGGIGERLAFLNQTFNPIEGIGGSMRAASRMAAPDQSYWDRISALGEMVSGVASIAAPVAAARAIGVPAASAMMEGLLGGSPTTQAAGDMARQFVADESGAVPLMGGGTAGPTQEAKQAAENAFAAARQAYENNPVNARGAQIIDMLTSGRADEITDQMLDMGDPVLNANLNQYLYRNYDLPMDEASRMERARQMGFSIDPKYHGSFSEDIPAFSGDMLGKRFNNRASKAGVWSSTNPDDAEFYGPNTYPVLLGGRYESLPSMEDMYRDTLGRLKSTQAKMERDYMGERYSSEAEKRLSRLVDIMENDQPPSLYTDIAASNISKAKGKKFEGAVLRGGETVQDVSPAGDNYVTFDPANIRSRFARFDPRLSHLRNLSAGVGGAAVLTALGDDAEAGTPEMQIIGLVNQAGIAGAAEALGVSRRDIEEAISIAVPPSQWDQLVAGPQ